MYLRYKVIYDGYNYNNAICGIKKTASRKVIKALLLELCRKL
jgi:hypothetical protein